MAQFDAVLRFNTLAAAEADPDVQQHYDAVADVFAADRVARVDVWRASQDTVGNGGSIVHSFMSGVFLLISMPRLVTSLRDNAAIQLVLNRDKMNAREPGFVVRSTISAGILQDIRFGPVFAGMDVPWAGLN
jgi:hypothetical protein